VPKLPLTKELIQKHLLGTDPFPAQMLWVIFVQLIYEYCITNAKPISGMSLLAGEA
jgi:hypothetical protein